MPQISDQSLHCTQIKLLPVSHPNPGKTETRLKRAAKPWIKHLSAQYNITRSVISHILSFLLELSSLWLRTSCNLCIRVQNIRYLSNRNTGRYQLWVPHGMRTSASWVKVHPRSLYCLIFCYFLYRIHEKSLMWTLLIEKQKKKYDLITN